MQAQRQSKTPRLILIINSPAGKYFENRSASANEQRKPQGNQSLIINNSSVAKDLPGNKGFNSEAPRVKP
jgi:hypothetical protein